MCIRDRVCSACRWINFKKRDTCLKCQNFVNQENFEQATPYVQPGESKKHMGCLGAANNAAINPKERPRWCDLCKVECPGEVSFHEHSSGKKHLAKARQSRQVIPGRIGTARTKSDEVAIALPRPREAAAWDGQQGRPAEQPYKLPEAAQSSGEPAPLLGGLVSKKKTFAEALSGASKPATSSAPGSPVAVSPPQGADAAPTSPQALSIGQQAGPIGGFNGFAIEQPATAPGGEPWGMRGTALWGLPEQANELGGDLWVGAGLGGLGVDGIAPAQAPGSPAISPAGSATTWKSEVGSPNADKPQEADNIWKSASDNAVAWGASFPGQQQLTPPAPEGLYAEEPQADQDGLLQPVEASRQAVPHLAEDMQQASLQDPPAGGTPPGMWPGGPQQWEGKGGNVGQSQDDRQGIWDPTQHFGAAPTVNSGPGTGHIVSWDHQMGYAQTREGFLVLVCLYDISNGTIPQQGQQVRWQSLQQDSSGQGYRAMNVELLSSEFMQPREWNGQQQNTHPEQYNERGGEEPSWGNGSQHQQFGQQFMGPPQEYSKQGYGQQVYQHQQGHQPMGYPPGGGQGWASQPQGTSWGQGYPQQGGYNRGGAAFGGGNYWGAQGHAQGGAQQGMPPNGLKMGSQFGQTSSVWSQPNSNHNGMDHTTMSWGGAGR
eukprot:TRINITY_DN2687_c0_g1_i3.p1 TRINITY_DN2687_c0_g1~~TRINITY_DN2687_c0_g1_i3.p1  ORF type:complete len:658 (-),score=140.27 TRINITY_DN2687_c0_g1_i3:261-2234(-)